MEFPLSPSTNVTVAQRVLPRGFPLLSARRQVRSRIQVARRQQPQQHDAQPDNRPRQPKGQAIRVGSFRRGGFRQNGFTRCGTADCVGRGAVRRWAAANTPDSCPHTAPAPTHGSARGAAADADSAAACNTLSAADTTRARQSAAAWLAAQARAVDSVNLIAADSPASAAPDVASPAALPARMGLPAPDSGHFVWDAVCFPCEPSLASSAA